MVYYDDLQNVKPKKTIIFSVEGNIGSGKSTLLKLLEAAYMNENINICFLQEPVKEWDNFKDSEGISILENYYKDQVKYSFQFQMMAYITRLNSLRKALKKNYDIIITERSVMTDKNVFAKMLFDSNKISKIEYEIYNTWFNEFLDDIPEQFIIYLETNPDIANDRVLKRGREGENIPIEYLRQCHQYHHNWLINDFESNNLIKIDGNHNYFDNKNYLKSSIDQISNFIKNKILANMPYFKPINLS